MPKIGHRSESKIDLEELRNVTAYRLQQSSIDLHKLTIYRLDQWQCPRSTVDSRLIRLRLSRGFIRVVSPSYSAPGHLWCNLGSLYLRIFLSNSGGIHSISLIQAFTDVCCLDVDEGINPFLGQVISSCSPCISASATAGLLCARLAGQTNLIKTLLVTPQQDYTPAIRPAPAPEQFLIQLVTFAKLEGP